MCSRACFPSQQFRNTGTKSCRNEGEKICGVKIKLLEPHCIPYDIYIEDICFFSVKDQNLFHRVDTIGNIFTRGESSGHHR